MADNKYTPVIILRALTDKIGKSDAETFKDQRAAILQSLDKIMGTTCNPDIIDAFEKLNYGDSYSLEKIKKAPFLPRKRVEKTINGQKADVIYFTDESPLLKIAKLKGQILTYDAELLDAPNQQNAPLYYHARKLCFAPRFGNYQTSATGSRFQNLHVPIPRQPFNRPDFSIDFCNTTEKKFF